MAASKQLFCWPQRPLLAGDCPTPTRWPPIDSSRPAADLRDRPLLGRQYLATVPGDQRCLGTAYACSNTMFHSNLTSSRDSTALQMVNSGSWCRADIVDISRSFSL